MMIAHVKVPTCRSNCKCILKALKLNTEVSALSSRSKVSVPHLYPCRSFVTQLTTSGRPLDVERQWERQSFVSRNN